MAPAGEAPLLGGEVAGFKRSGTSDREDNVKAYKAWMMESRILDWFGSRETVEQAFKIIEGHPEHASQDVFDIENYIVGPALKYAFWANYIVWGGAIFLTGFAWHLVRVDSTTGIANPPSGIELLQGVVIFLVGICICLYFEVKAAMHVLPCQSVGIKKPGMGMPFWMWLSVMAIISIALHADIYTTSIFIARVIKSTTVDVHFLAGSGNISSFITSDAYKHNFTWWWGETQHNTYSFMWAMHNPCNSVNYQWQQTVVNSTLSSPSFGWFFEHNSFVEITIYAGCLMFLQFVYALCYSWPVSPDLNAKEITREKPGTHVVHGRRLPGCHGEQGRTDPAKYNTFLKKSTGHGRALQALAESGRMNILNWQDDNYLEVAEQEWDSPNVVQEMRRGNMRFMLFGLQSVVIANLQITYLAFQNAKIAGDHDMQPDRLTFYSSCLTVACGLKYVIWELFTLRKHHTFATDALGKDTKKAKEEGDNALAWSTHVLTRWVHVRKLANLFFCAFFTFMFAYLTLKAYMDTVGCGGGRIWNWDSDIIWSRGGAIEHGAGCMRLNFNVSDYYGNSDTCNVNVSS